MTIFSLKSVEWKAVCIALLENNTWPVFLHKKQVTVSFVMNTWYEVLSKTIAIDPGSFEKSSGGLCIVLSTKTFENLIHRRVWEYYFYTKYCVALQRWSCLV